MLKASYFSFVTISTIGFGDVVPGVADFEHQEDQIKLIGTALYMLFGMATISMCFSLIQEEIVAKCRLMGERMGIIDTPGSVREDSEAGSKLDNSVA